MATDGIGSLSSLAKTACPISAPCFCAVSGRPISSLMSAPAQNALAPAPVMSRARASLPATSSKARPRSAISANESAFSASGRFRVISANSSTRVSSIAMITYIMKQFQEILLTTRTQRIKTLNRKGREGRKGNQGQQKYHDMNRRDALNAICLFVLDFCFSFAPFASFAVKAFKPCASQETPSAPTPA